ncbi:MAG: 3-deoxy-D-manno-octulosonic-acid transferase [Flavobacteriaceae bacterium]|jgi:3-deoxy-D-manno-octulosonic-acid transferase
MRFIYTFGVNCYGIALRIASLFNPKAKKWIKGRQGLLLNLPDLSNEEVHWFHCASLGEFDQGLPLMKRLKDEQPNIFLVVTFFSPSGFEHYQKRAHVADLVCYLPLDTPSNARKFIKKTQPKSVYFIKYEFWANYIFAAKKSGSNIYNVSGIFREKHRFFKWYGGFFRSVLSQFDFFFVQNKSSEELLLGIGIENVGITGDSRFDRVIENRKTVKSNEVIKAFKGENDLFIIGSSWPEDEELLSPWINASADKLLIAPHEVDKKHIDRIIVGISRKCVRYSEADLTTINEADVLIIDSIGLLASAYKYGTSAYIGGGFTGNLHNILEPAVFGLPVIFGPKHTRFPEAQAFIDGGFGFSISTTSEFKAAFETIKTNLKLIGANELDFVEKNAGATERIIQHITSN